MWKNHYFAFLEASSTLSLICFSSLGAMTAEGLGWFTPNECPSDVLPRGKARTLLSSPDRTCFWLPNVIGSSDKHWGKGGTSNEDVLLHLPELLPGPNIVHLLPVKQLLNSSHHSTYPCWIEILLVSLNSLAFPDPQKAVKIIICHSYIGKIKEPLVQEKWPKLSVLPQCWTRKLG